LEDISIQSWKKRIFEYWPAISDDFDCHLWKEKNIIYGKKNSKKKFKFLQIFFAAPSPLF